MTRIALLPVLLVLLITAVAFADPGEMILWYDKPAEKWTEALPVGHDILESLPRSDRRQLLAARSQTKWPHRWQETRLP